MNRKNILKAFLALAAAFSLTQAELVSVEVDKDCIHREGNMFFGRVTYDCSVGSNALGLYEQDSLYVTLEIVPKAGGDALKLDNVEGAVGVLHYLPQQTKRDIWFRVSNVPAGEYIARVKINAIETETMKRTKAMVGAGKVADFYPLFVGGVDEKNPNGGSFFFQPGVTVGGYKMADIKTQDGPHGINYDHYQEKGSAFPTCGSIACTWDEDNAYQQGVLIGEEFRAIGRNVNLGPGMNIVMHPQQGRGFEYYSEDSYLAGKLGAAQVRGLAARGVIGTAKHFAGNQMETDRNQMSADIDERSLQELYLPQFKRAVVDGNALAVMSAYNMVNGQYCTDSKYLLDDILRKQWGFLGYIMSDWDAKVSDQTLGNVVKWGADQLLPTALWKANNFTDADAKNKAKHIIYTMGKIGGLESNYNHKAYTNTLLSSDHISYIRKTGGKSIVLAKNEGNVLPLPKTGKKIFIIGADIKIDRPESIYNKGTNPNEADATRLGGGDSFKWESSLVKPDEKYLISPRKGITNYLNALTESGKTTIVSNMYEADYIVCVVGVHCEGEGADRPDMFVLKENIVTEALKVTTAKTIVIFAGGTPALPGEWTKAPAVLICFGPGMEQGHSMADIIFGDVCPSGKLNVTFPKTSNQVANFPKPLPNKRLKYGAPHEAHGYFKVDALGQEPLFAFGHGLSYTTFEYSNLKVFPSTVKNGDRVYVSVDVRNKGTTKGDEVAQLYLSLPSGTVPVRKQDLRGFRRVSLDAGQTKNVLFAIDPEDMAYFKVGSKEFDGTGSWQILTGNYGVRVGTSSKITPAPDQPSVSSKFTVN